MFFPNWPDDNHCLQAAIMMILNTNDHPISWEKVNKITQYEDGLYTWSPAGVISLSERITGVRMVSNLDYEQFAARGEDFLKESWSDDWFKSQQLHASKHFEKEKTLTRKLIDKSLFKLKILKQEDIEQLLDGNLLIALVDAGRLVNQNYTAGHFVVVFDQDKDNFYIHDPGLPPQENWQVNKKDFTQAFRGDLIIVPIKIVLNH